MGSWPQVRQEGARAVKASPAEPGPQAKSHLCSERSWSTLQGEEVSGFWFLGTTYVLDVLHAPESCTSQLMRAQTPVDNHQKGGKIEAQCLGTSRELLVSFLVEGAEARFSKPTREETEKRGCPDSQLRRTEPSGSPPHLSGLGWRGGSRHRRARRGLGRQPGLPGWKGQGRPACLATHAGSRDYARRLPQAPSRSLSPSAEPSGGRAPRGPKTPNCDGAVGRRRSPRRAQLGRKTRTARSRKGRGLQRAGPSLPSWTPDPGFYQSLPDQGPRGFYGPLSPGPWGRGAGDPATSLPAGPSLLVPAPRVVAKPPTHPSSPHLCERGFLQAWGLSDAPMSHSNPTRCPSLCQSARRAF